jgi:hypothetical protein
MKEQILGFLLLAGFGLALLLVFVGGSYLEAKTYNRLTGAKVSTWDAIWVDLRVQEQTLK